MTYFEHYYGRLRDYYKPDEEKAAKRILRQLALHGSLTRDTCYQLYRAEVSGDANVEHFNHLNDRPRKRFLCQPEREPERLLVLM